MAFFSMEPLTLKDDAADLPHETSLTLLLGIADICGTSSRGLKGCRNVQ